MHGHLAARLDPLGSEPMGDPALDETRLVPPLTPELQERIPAKLIRVHVPGETLKDVLPKLREIYCGTIAYEIEHISDHAERVWLRQAIESGRYRTPLAREEAVRLLELVSRAEGFEQYLRRAFLGQKQFSLEGLDVMVPMLDEAIEIAAGSGAHEVVIGMAHRGRLNVLAHTIGRPYETILREFEGERTIDAVVVERRGRHRRRQVPPRGNGTRVDRFRRGHGHARAEPEPPRGGRSRHRGLDARRADRPLPRRRRPRPVGRTADPHPRRRVLRRPGCRRGDAQPLEPRRLHDRRHAPPDREQPGRLHRPIRPRGAPPATRATSRRASTSRSCTSTPTTRKRRSPPSGWRSRTGRSSVTTSSST